MTPCTERERLQVLSNQTILNKDLEELPQSVVIAKYELSEQESYEHVNAFESGVLKPDDVLDMDSLEDIPEKRYLTREEYQPWVEEQVQVAKSNGLKNEKEFRRILNSRFGAFGGSIDDLKPAKVTPMRLNLKKDATPVFIKPRKCSYKALIWLKERMNKLISLGLARKAKNPVWGFPVFIKSKPGKTDDFRLLFDLRAINERINMTSLPLPQLESMLNSLTNSKIYAILDLLKGFNALPVHPDSQGIFVAVTPIGCIELLVAPQGCSICPGVFHDRVTTEVLTEDYISNSLNWIDDCLIKAGTELDFLENLDRILGKFEAMGFKISVSKAVLYTLKVVWAGRHIEDSKIKFEERFYTKIMQWAAPKYGNELSQFLYALNWIKMTILQARESITWLRENVLEPLYARCKTRTEKALAAQLIGALWNKLAQWHFDNIKRKVKNHISLAVPDYTKQFCIFTDSCDFLWSFLVTQIPLEDVGKDFEEQNHEILCTMDNKYSTAERKYHISEKEAAPIVFGLKRFGYLFQMLDRPVLIFNDHKNIEAIFNPSKEYNAAVLSRLYRWSLEIQQFWYRIIHIEGLKNLWADMMSRWCSELYHEQTPTNLARITLGYNVVEAAIAEEEEEEEELSEYEKYLYERVRPLYKPEFDYPDIKSIKEAQMKHEESQEPYPAQVEYNHETGVFEYKGRAWIPNDPRLQTRIIIVAHVTTGHPGNDIVAQQIRKRFYWPASIMERQIAKYKKACLHCCSNYPKKERRKLGKHRSAKARNESIHQDYLYLVKDLYLLVLKDDASQKIEFQICKVPDARTTAVAVLYWRARFGLLLDSEFISDNGSHFANKFLKALFEALKFKQRFRIKYSPWSNGRIERVNKEVLKLLRILKSEFRVSDLDLDFILPQILYYLNNTPSKLLDEHTPNEVYLGSGTNQSPIDFIYYKDGDKVLKVEIGKISKYLESLRNQINQKLDAIFDLKAKIREQRTKQANERLNVNHLQFSEGDLVLKAQLKKRSKTCMTWIGPYIVDKVINEFVYAIQDIVTNETEEVHVVFLRLYEEKWYNVTEDVKEQYIHDSNEYEVEKFLDIRATADDVELYTKWRGFPEEYNTWEPLVSMKEDVPRLVDNFKRKFPSKLWEGM